MMVTAWRAPESARGDASAKPLRSLTDRGYRFMKVLNGSGGPSSGGVRFIAALRAYD